MPRATILIVDDHPHNIGVLFNLLDQAGFEVRIAQDGESCLEKVVADPPDLILLDILMPGMDGWETCRRLQVNPTLKQIPIIFMTALTQTEDKVQGLKAGAVDYVTKPFNQEEVLARIRLHLKLADLTQKLQVEVEERTTVQKALFQLNHELEARVKQRTQALQDLLQELELQKQRFEYAALHDSLTGLPNRNWLMSYLTTLIAEKSSAYGVLFLDLDRFKAVNDSLGHSIGDSLLQGVAKRLQACVGSVGAITRLGGDEFIVVLPDLDQVETPQHLAEEICQVLRQPFLINQYTVNTSTSIGITTSEFAYENPEEILKDADIAMYHAKQNPTQGYAVLTQQLQQQARSRFQLEQDLCQGITEGQFYLCYQPIVSLHNEQRVGFEALIRWQHPQYGVVSPDLFIPVAEETGMIQELGVWILESAIAQLASWRKEFPQLSPFYLNINISALQLEADNFIPTLERLLTHYQIPGQGIKLELTESCLLKISTQASHIFQHLQTLGIQLCIDDFGTGYSALSRLYEFPVNTLKIDKSFVQHLDQDSDTTIIATILALGDQLDLAVVAEGVETPKQVEILRTLGCPFAQGYWFARPMTVQQVTTALTSDFSNQLPVTSYQLPVTSDRDAVKN